MNEEPKITRWIYNENGNITAVDVMYKGIGKIFYSTEPAIKELLLEKIDLTIKEIYELPSFKIETYFHPVVNREDVNTKLHYLKQLIKDL